MANRKGATDTGALLMFGEHRPLACCRRQLADGSQGCARIARNECSMSFLTGCRKEQASSLCCPEAARYPTCALNRQAWV
jgi:hypothetical protein